MPTHDKPNSTRSRRAIDNLDDRPKPNEVPANASAAPGGPGFGRKMPRASDDVKIAQTTEDVAGADSLKP
jgi:hypothetical protein